MLKGRRKTCKALVCWCSWNRRTLHIHTKLSVSKAYASQKTSSIAMAHGHNSGGKHSTRQWQDRPFYTDMAMEPHAMHLWCMVTTATCHAMHLLLSCEEDVQHAQCWQSSCKSENVEHGASWNHMPCICYCPMRKTSSMQPRPYFSKLARPPCTVPCMQRTNTSGTTRSVACWPAFFGNGRFFKSTFSGNRQTDKQTDRQTDKQTDRQTDRQISPVRPLRVIAFVLSLQGG